MFGFIKNTYNRLAVARNVMMIELLAERGLLFLHADERQLGDMVVRIITDGSKGYGRISDNVKSLFDKKPQHIQNCIIAMAMHEIGIKAPIDHQKWYCPRNPFDVRVYDENAIEIVRKDFEKDFGIEMPLFELCDNPGQYFVSFDWDSLGIETFHSLERK